MSSPPSNNDSVLVLLPIMLAVFLSFMVIGMVLPVLPIHIRYVLGFGPFVVGIITGCQFTASMLTRFSAGRLADSRTPKHAVVTGLAATVVGGLFYLVSLSLLDLPALSITAIFVGRICLGAAESLMITGGVAWGLSLASPHASGKVIAWVGSALFAALAVGAPIGSYLFSKTGFLGIAVATALIPLVVLAIVLPLKSSPTRSSSKPRLSTVFKAVFLPGLGLALSGILFGAMTGFLTLYFYSRGWDSGAWAFATFAASLVLTRFILGNLTDRFGGARVVIICLIVQILGLLLINLAPSAEFAIVGSFICGAGFSLVFPGFGLEAVRRAPIDGRGLAMGTYAAFMDLALGLGTPALGFMGGAVSLGFVFIATAIASLLAIPIAVHLMRRSPQPLK